MSSDQCLFCKMVAGEIPVTKVYEDEAVLAFLDIALFLSILLLHLSFSPYIALLLALLLLLPSSYSILSLSLIFLSSLPFLVVFVSDTIIPNFSISLRCLRAAGLLIFNSFVEYARPIEPKMRQI